ncbi:hypothetical protein KKF84_07315 [Myxococcota bacterium]|nr:hypothetical protein [Myxococcota bacterium]MBU1535112.1 hypothetical protein [Myxococcota bacterium]
MKMVIATSILASLMLLPGCSKESTSSTPAPTLPETTPPSRSQATQPPATKGKPQPTQDILSFLARFEQAVGAKQVKTILALTDAEYRKNQHDSLLKGNTVQFIDGLFCGNLAQAKGFACITLAQIKTMERLHVSKSTQGFEVEYKVSSATKAIICTWVVKIRSSGSLKTLGLEGASG